MNKKYWIIYIVFLFLNWGLDYTGEFKNSSLGLVAQIIIDLVLFLGAAYILFDMIRYLLKSRNRRVAKK